MSLDKETVKKVAKLAHLEMKDDELEKLVPQLNGIIDWGEQLSEVDTDNVEPLASVTDIDLPLRKDEVNDGQCADKVLGNAPEETMGFFVVPKVVETEE